MKPGDAFGFVVVLSRGLRGDRKHSYWLVRCVCGKEWEARADSLKSSRIRSCGCKKPGRPTHGMSFSPEYVCWGGMIQRCTNPKSAAYRHYGGRGITVCDRWRTFENFYADIGPRPAGMSLERKDNERGYSPDNCVWATKAQQMRNVRNAKIVILGGQRMALNQARNELGLGSGTVNNRMRQYGETPQQAINWYFAMEMVEAAA